MKLLHDDGESLLIPDSIEIDFGEYHLIRGIKLRNSAEGTRTARLYLRIFREVEIFLKSGVDSQYIDLPDSEDLFLFNFSGARMIRRILLEVLASHGEARESGLSYIGLVTEDTDPFLLSFTDSYLSVGKAGLLFPHPYSCRSGRETVWQCEAGRLRNSNGGVLTFHDPSLLSSLPDYVDLGLNIPQEDGGQHGLVPSTARPGAHSTAVTFSDVGVTFTIGGASYHLRPRRHPNVTLVLAEDNSAGDGGHTVTRTRPWRHFEYVEADEDHCYEFPEEVESCGGDGCSMEESLEVCRQLQGAVVETIDQDVRNMVMMGSQYYLPI